jgi:hypothetical protein
MGNRGSERRNYKTALTATGVLALVALVFSQYAVETSAHGFGSQITWNREISRIVYAHCASCHRPGSTAFSLMTYADAQPRANEIKDAVLSRRMPPWGAVKGFGHFRNDQSLTQEQIELITKWVDGGIRRGNNPRLLPGAPVFNTAPQPAVTGDRVRVQGPLALSHAIVLDGLQPERAPAGRSMRIIATLPDGSIQPLVWLHGYDNRYPHAFLLRQPLRLPAGSVIQGVPADAVVALIAAF